MDREMGPSVLPLIPQTFIGYLSGTGAWDKMP